MARTVTEAFNEFRGRLILTDRQKQLATGRISNLRTIFDQDFDVAKKPWAIGSYGRETIIRLERDIDVMVALSVSGYWKTYENNSAAFLRMVRDRLNKRYPNTKVSTRQIAVVLELGEDLEVDLVPGFHRTGGGFLIPNGSGRWLATNPPFHDDLMANANMRLGSRLKPLVRLMKAWNVCNQRHLRSFHLEMIVEKMWRKPTQVPLYQNAVANSLEVAASYVKPRFPDPWKPDQMIDDYLTSTNRNEAIRKLNDDAQRAKDAMRAEAGGDHKSAIEDWGIVFYGQFPAYG